MAEQAAPPTIVLSGTIKSTTGTPLMSSLGYQSVLISPNSPIPSTLQEKVIACRLAIQEEQTPGVVAIMTEIEFIPLNPSLFFNKESSPTSANTTVQIYMDRVIRNVMLDAPPPVINEMIQSDLARSPHASFSRLFDRDSKRRIQTGTFGILYAMTRRKDGKEFAVRIIDKTSLTGTEFARIDSEIEILEHLPAHAHLLRAYGVFDWTNPKKKNVRIVTELCASPNLAELLGSEGHLSESRALTYAVSVGRALETLHNESVVHRNLRAENILFDADGVLKVSGFYWANRTSGVAIDEIFMNAMAGTPQYVAPEILRNDEYGFQVDYWSFGVLVFFMLGGRLPFMFGPVGDEHGNENVTKTVKALFAEIMEGRYDMNVLERVGVSENAQDCVRRLMCVDVGERMNATTFWAHPWVASSGR